MRPTGSFCAMAAIGASLIGQSAPSRPETVPLLTAHLAQEADRFRRSAPAMLAQETLEQRARENRPGSLFEGREVISAYGFAALKSAPNALHEVRKVISVDGNQITTLEKAREALTLGLHSTDDKMKKRLLEEFEKHGLRGAVTDFGQVILLFSSRNLPNYDFEIRGERLIGADRLIALAFTQKAGDSGLTVFLGNAAKREPLRGEILMRKTDWAPLRITLTASQTVRDLPMREESTVDYKAYPTVAVLPVSVVHREYVNGELLSENQFSYSSFRRLEPGSALRLPAAN